MIARLRASLGAAWPPTPPSRASAGQLALAVGIGLVGALVFKWLSLPLPWMLGALLATTLAAMFRAPIAVPAGLRPPMMAVLGVLIGSGFNRELLQGMALWLPSMAAIPLYIIVVSALAIAFLRKAAGLDPRTAYFTAPPAGLAEMVVLGDRHGGDVRTISLAHALRILLVVFTVPLALFWIEGVDGATRAAPVAAGPLRAGDTLVLVLSGIVGAFGGVAVRLPAATMLGPMLASALAHLLGLVDGAPPGAIVAVAQLVIGAAVGSRFRGVDPVQLVRISGTTLGLVALMLSVTLAFAGALAWATGLPLDLLVLAYAPGGIAEMGLIAFVLGVDPTFVATHHIVRVTLTVVMVPACFALYRRWCGLGA